MLYVIFGICVMSIIALIIKSLIDKKNLSKEEAVKLLLLNENNIQMSKNKKKKVPQIPDPKPNVKPLPKLPPQKKFDISLMPEVVDAIINFSASIDKVKMNEVKEKENKQENLIKEIRAQSAAVNHAKLTTCVCCNFKDPSEKSDLFEYIKLDTGELRPYCSPYCKILLDMVCMGCGKGYPMSNTKYNQKINGKTYCINCAKRKKENYNGK